MPRPDAQTLDASDRSRTAAQTARIVERLRAGPATNVELARIALKYTSRISDAREQGYQIRCVRIGQGVTEYQPPGFTETKQMDLPLEGSQC